MNIEQALLYEHYMKKQEILESAKAAFTEATGGVLELIKVPPKAIEPFDLLVRIKLRQYKEILLVDVKNEVRKQDVPQILELFRKEIDAYKHDKMLIAQYIPGPVKDELKKQHINYLEAAGNCTIALEHLFILVNDRKATQARKTKIGKLWNKTGLKYVYAVLTDRTFLKLPLREQAAKAGIALGNLTGLREELNLNWVYGEKKGATLALERLLEHWAMQYNLTLKPGQEIGTFRFLKPEMKEHWRNLPLAKKTWWGGENAGALLTNYLKPKRFTVYTRNQAQVMVDWKLVPDENGDIQLYEPFWPVTEDMPNQKTIHPIIAWAELNFELDQRLRETAIRIKEKIEGDLFQHG